MNDGPEDRTGLDDELRRLFADDRLTLPVSQGADRSVLAGAHRRRRQRLAVAAAGGVLAVVAVVTVGLGLSGVVRGPARQVVAASQPPSVTLTTTSSATPTPTDWRLLGPFGIGPVRLGMSLSEVKAVPVKSGSAYSTIEGGNCQALNAIEYANLDPTGRTVVNGTPVATPPMVAQSQAAAQSAMAAKEHMPFTVQVIVSPTTGVVRIGGSELLHTPEGVGIGSRIVEVERLYKATTRPMSTPTKQIVLQAPVPGNPGAVYRFDCDPDGTVVGIWLESVKAIC